MKGHFYRPLLTALRYDDWKLIFMEQRVEATMQAWSEPLYRCGSR